MMCQYQGFHSPTLAQVAHPTTAEALASTDRWFWNRLPWQRCRKCCSPSHGTSACHSEAWGPSKGTTNHHFFNSFKLSKGGRIFREVIDASGPRSLRGARKGTPNSHSHSCCVVTGPRNGVLLRVVAPRAGAFPVPLGPQGPHPPRPNSVLPLSCLTTCLTRDVTETSTHDEFCCARLVMGDLRWLMLDEQLNDIAWECHVNC